MKKCNSCQQEIDSKATKCPHCHADQRNWFSRHKILTAIIVIIVLIKIGAAVGGNQTSNNQTSSSNHKQQPTTIPSNNKPQIAKIGELARDGKFEFVVKSIECGKATIGTNEFLRKDAQGQFCLLSVSVKNIGDVKQSLFSFNQKLFDAAGKEYSADDTATLYITPQGSSWYSEINPGNSVEGRIVFDIPKNVTPITAELHDSAFSYGVNVSLQ